MMIHKDIKNVEFYNTEGKYLRSIAIRPSANRLLIKEIIHSHLENENHSEQDFNVREIAPDHYEVTVNSDQRVLYKIKCVESTLIFKKRRSQKSTTLLEILE